MKRFAHISDLHVGRNQETDERAAALCGALLNQGIDCVIATGDITHRGLQRELETFKDLFAPLISAERLVVVPGNHDCLGDDVSQGLMPGPRVQTATRSGVYVVRVNSTAAHNRSWLTGQGSLDDADLDAVDAALDAAPPGHVVAIALHHHVLPMPEEHAMERLSSWLGFSFTSELERGRDLLTRIRSRCDLVLHGHRHVPRGARLYGSPRPLHVFNGGSSTQLGRAWVFAHDGQGALLGGPLWLEIPMMWSGISEVFGEDAGPPFRLALTP